MIDHCSKMFLLKHENWALSQTSLSIPSIAVLLPFGGMNRRICLKRLRDVDSFPQRLKRARWDNRKVTLETQKQKDFIYFYCLVQSTMISLKISSTAIVGEPR
jgi:hypothetical protein